MNLIQEMVAGVTLLAKGGPLLVPILFLSVLSATVILERTRNLRRDRYIPAEYAARIFRLTERGKHDLAIELCRSRPMLLTNMLRFAITHRHLPEEELLRDVRKHLRNHIPDLYRNHFVLVFVASVAPLLGLLGTVLGMIHGFSALQMEGGGHLQMRIVADGISVALFTTFAGLAVAVPTFVMHEVLQHRADQLAAQLYRYGVSTVRFLKTEEVHLFPNHGEEAHSVAAPPAASAERRGHVVASPVAVAFPRPAEKGG
jgi:biopolymer transport protein ExbB